MSPQMGRPKSENPKSERLFIRVTPEDKKEIQDFSKESGYGLLELLKLGIETLKKKIERCPTTNHNNALP